MRTLIRHFFDRFFDTESFSPQGEPRADVPQMLGLLAAPGGFLVLLFQMFPFYSWDIVTVRCFFISLSMIVVGFLVVFEWDALYPDQRDYKILTPLPVELWRLFVAKAIALWLFLGLFLIDVNALSALMWRGIDGSGNVVRALAAHLTVVLLSGMFSVLAIATLQGVLIAALPSAAFRTVSVWIQTIAAGAMVTWLILSPWLASLLPGLAKGRSFWVYVYPAYWFTGLYEHLNPAVGDAAYLSRHPGDAAAVTFLVQVGRLAAWGSAGVIASFVLVCLPGYRQHARKVMETYETIPSGAGSLRRAIGGRINRHLLKQPVQIAVFHFINQTIVRSAKHRLFLATYAGAGIAATILTTGPDSTGFLQLPLMLSFLLISALRAVFNFPSELRANWLFRVSEYAHLRDSAAAVRKWIAACALGPLLLLQACMEFARFPWKAAVFHLLFGIVLSVLLTETVFLGFHKVPFTCSYLPGKVNLATLVPVYVFGFTAYSQKMADLEVWLEGKPEAIGAFLAASGLLYALLTNWRNRQLRGDSVLQFEDDGEPAVRTLELSA